MRFYLSVIFWTKITMLCHLTLSVYAFDTLVKVEYVNLIKYE